MIAPGASARSRLSVRRAVLPWRRRIRPSRFDFTPGGGFANLLEEPLGLLLAVVLVPLWLPAAVVTVPALAEVVVELLVLPFTLLVRASRHRWPVQLLEDSRLLREETCPSYGEAGRLARRWRDEARLL